MNKVNAILVSKSLCLEREKNVPCVCVRPLFCICWLTIMWKNARICSFFSQPFVSKTGISLATNVSVTFRIQSRGSTLTLTARQPSVRSSQPSRMKKKTGKEMCTYEALPGGNPFSLVPIKNLHVLPCSRNYFQSCSQLFDP